MNFTEAMSAMFAGKKVRCAEWPADQYMFYDPEAWGLKDETGMTLDLHDLDHEGTWEEFTGPVRMSVVKITDDWFDIVGDLGPDEVRVVLHVAKHVADRLRLGARQYGALDIAADKRDWAHEASEEMADGAIYLAIDALKRGGT
jgi:hypothetical protein